MNHFLKCRLLESHATRRTRQRRSGIATLWLILVLPALMILLCLVIEIGNLWLARLELENSLEAASLAAVQEWGAAGGGSTLLPRQVGRQFAEENRVRGEVVMLDLNHDPSPGKPNENEQLSGETADLVFGAITSTSPTVVFNANVIPSCGLGTVLFDASDNPNMQQLNAWGINFHPVATVANLTIREVEYNLRAGGDPNARFDLGGTPPVLSDNSTNKVTYQDTAPAGQVDVAGLSTAPLSAVTAGTVTTWSNSQVAFVWDSASPHRLTLRFSAIGGDAGFEPGDRLRFGARIINLDPVPNATDDGDAAGVSQVQVRLVYAIAGLPQPDAFGTFQNSNFRHFLANYPPHLAPVSTNAFYLLPLAPAAGNNNDNQSYVEITGGAGGRSYAVSARATVQVPSLCSQAFGLGATPFSVSADTTALYDCAEQAPRTIRVDTYLP